MLNIRTIWKMGSVVGKRERKEGDLPFIQFFSGWKWKAVLCQANMAVVQLYESLRPENPRKDFSDTPWATPLPSLSIDGPSLSTVTGVCGLWWMTKATKETRNMREANVTAKTFKGRRCPRAGAPAGTGWSGRGE